MRPADSAGRIPFTGGLNMELHTLYDLINLQPEMVRQLKTAEKEISPDDYGLLLERLTHRDTAAKAYEALDASLQKDNLRMLYCQLQCACRIYDRYKEMHIPLSVFTDTMKCFPRFLDECLEKTGRMFFDRGWWTYRQISMSLFRIGALEYEFPEGEAESIAVHIPSDADLSPETVRKSLEEAGRFFASFYPEYSYDKYTCDSWLMSPVLKTLLPETSNILAFQNLFAVSGEGTDSSGCLEWLFRSPGCLDYRLLPASTSLQKKAKELLLRGGHIGFAHGEITLVDSVIRKDPRQ